MKSPINFLMALAAVLFFSVTAKADCSYAVPLEGTEIGIGNLLTWSTEIEINNKYFIVEKSFDGIEFGGAGIVEGNGDTDELKTYRFLDLSANAGLIYYRLKQVDFTGEATFTPIVAVNRNTTNNFMVTSMSSTTLDKDFAFNFESMVEGKIDFSISEKISQSIVKTGQIEARKGINESIIDLSALDNGIYQITIEMADEKETLYIQKVNSNEMPKTSYALKNR